MLFGRRMPETDEAKREHLDAMYTRAQEMFQGVPEVSAAELMRMREVGEVVLVDVRTPEEQAVSMIEGAMTVEEFADRCGEIDEDVPVVAYCTIGGRSGRFAKEMQERGRKVHNLRGAILAWTHEGGELVHDDQPTKQVHVHSSKFALAAEDYEAVW